MPVQRALQLADPACCCVCGRRWPDVFLGSVLDLGALARLSDAEFWTALRCWVGRCGGPRGA